MQQCKGQGEQRRGEERSRKEISSLFAFLLIYVPAQVVKPSSSAEVHAQKSKAKQCRRKRRKEDEKERKKEGRRVEERTMERRRRGKKKREKRAGLCHHYVHICVFEFAYGVDFHSRKSGGSCKAEKRRGEEDNSTKHGRVSVVGKVLQSRAEP